MKQSETVFLIDDEPALLNPNPAFEKSRFVREGRRTVVV